MNTQALTEDELNIVYNWVDEIPLSRPKKNISRDFADGVLMAEIVAHFLPKLVEVHNYSAAHSLSMKATNWDTLNKKVFKKMGFQLSKTDVDSVINCQPEAIERVLLYVKGKIDKYLENTQNQAPPEIMTKKQAVQYYQQQEQNPSQQEYIREQTINELKETIEILEMKVKKLEQLAKLKDSKIQALQNKLAQYGVN